MTDAKRKPRAWHLVDSNGVRKCDGKWRPLTFPTKAKATAHFREGDVSEGDVIYVARYLTIGG